MEFSTSEIWVLWQVIFIDLVLAGDNAIIVGMAAAGVAPEERRTVICGGIAMAVLLRILFAALTMQLLSIVGLMLAGGLLLLWVCWKFYRELREQTEEAIATALLNDPERAVSAARKSLRAAMIQVAVADVSMSLDNVLAVAGAATEHPRAMIIGLALSVVLMGVGASLIARLLQRHQWIAYLGLAVIDGVAIIVGMAAAGVAPEERRTVICGGIAMAVLLRILFAALTMQLLSIVGLMLAGGLLLLWVCWKFYRELREQTEEAIATALLNDPERAVSAARKSLRAAMIQVAVADVSMSLDNVLAVAGAATEHPRAMIIGLALSVVLMGVGASLIARLLQRHQWIAYLGLAVIGYVSISMIWHGTMELANVAWL